MDLNFDGGEMITITNGEWIVDLSKMECRHITDKIVVGFENINGMPQGKIKDMPVALFGKIAGKPHGADEIQKIVLDAEEVFLRAYYENLVEKI